MTQCGHVNCEAQTQCHANVIRKLLLNKIVYFIQTICAVFANVTFASK